MISGSSPLFFLTAQDTISGNSLSVYFLCISVISNCSFSPCGSSTDTCSTFSPVKSICIAALVAACAQVPVLAFLISPDAKMEDCSFLHSSTNFSVFILTCQIICMTVLHLFVTIFVLTFLFPCFDFTACNLHSRISGRLGLEVIRHLMKYDRPAGYQPLNALNSNSTE